MPGLAIPVTEAYYQSQDTVQELESGSQPQSDGSHRVYHPFHSFIPLEGRYLETPSTEGKTEAHSQCVSEVRLETSLFWLQFPLPLPV